MFSFCQLYDRINSDEIRPFNSPDSNAVQIVSDIVTFIEQGSYQDKSTNIRDLFDILLEPHLQVIEKRKKENLILIRNSLIVCMYITLV